ncbi:MAG: thiamine pyrophosphate-dependent enzyme [Acidimicrobiales bacterium]
MRSVGKALVDALVTLGTTHFYTVPGESFLEVIEAVRRSDRAELVSTRHESGASFMAEAHGKLTGRPAVAMATRAPGAANLAIGVHTARQDSTPLVALIGQVETQLMGSGLAFQEVDLEAFFGPLAKWTTSLRRPGDAVEIAQRAYGAATTGRPGPSIIALPADVLVEVFGGDASADPAPQQPGTPPLPECTELVERLARAQRPVMILGGRTAGCWDELRRLSERYQIGVYTAFRRQDRFPNDHDCYLGHLTVAPSPELLAPLRNADFVLSLGCRLGEVTTQHFTLPNEGVFFAHVDVEIDAPPRGPGRAPDVTFKSDVRAFLGTALGLRQTSSPPGRWREAHAIYEKDASLPTLPEGRLIQPSDVVAAMIDALPSNAIVASDAGNFSISLHRHWRFRHPHTQLAPTNGAMGYAVPAAVAAGLLRPDRTVVAVAGDGGFLMTGQELETAVRLGVNMVAVVMRNGLYGTIAMHQARSFGELAGVGIGDVDVARYASSLGAFGIRVNKRELLADALREALRAPGPAVVDVLVDPEAVAPGVRLSALIAEGRRGR